MTENGELFELRTRIPFLNQIPDDIFFNLATSEFYLPEGDVYDARIELEKKLGNYVMTYQRDVLNLDIPVERHLCANIKPAELTETQYKILQFFEERYGRVNFVVYQKPLELIDPSKSDMYKLYVKRGLIEGLMS